MGRQAKEPRWKVAVTGANSDLAALLFPLLEADPRVESILAVDSARPEQASGKQEYRRVDLARPEAERALAETLTESQVDVLYHLALPLSPVGMGALAHELEVAGTLNVLSAAARAKVGRLVFTSFTVVYGARGENPALLTEQAPLRGCPGSRFVSDKVEVERQVEAFRQAHPEIRVLVLRFAPIVGSRVDNPATRFLHQRLVPTLMGFDPNWQVLHEEDAVRALHLALDAQGEGPVNVVGQGIVSLSGVVHLAGGQVLPLPGPLARGAISALNALGLSRMPLSMLDYVRFSWVADGRHAKEALGFVPRFAATAAIAGVQGGR